MALIGAPSLLIYALLAYLLGSWLHLYGWKLWVFRFALWFLGIVAFGLIYWFTKQSREAAEEQEVGDEDLDSTLAEARSRLVASPTAPSAKLSDLPLVLLVGPEGSTKTSAVVHSGLDPELLGGAVFHGDTVAPTPGVNLWYARNTLFAELGGAFIAERERLARLIPSIRSHTLGAAFSGRAPAPRVAVVCFSCEELLKPDAASGVPVAARELREILVELAHGLGTQLPVYVLFTKADRIPYFAEYVRNLSRDEAQQVLGSTLRWPVQDADKRSADREYQRVSEAFQRVFDSLAEKRLPLLRREADDERHAGVYEFPREFRKISSLASQFLVDLCRPSQLKVSPVLRGFYFAGVRAVVVSDAASVEEPQVAPTADADRIAATQVFDVRRHRPEIDRTGRTGAGSRKIPQWVFLERLFKDVILGDRMAMGVTQSSARLNLWRRMALATAVGFCLILSTCFTVSMVGNRRLVASATSTAAELMREEQIEPELLDRFALERIDELREDVEQIVEWERAGPPLYLRWGLYKGSALYPLVRDLYFERFETLMLQPARRTLLDSLLNLPNEPEATSEYQPNYNLLKAYLMTTGSCPIDSAFLAPVLWDRWLDQHELDPERHDIARRQFDFYAGKLCSDEEHPCVADYDPRAVRRARAFLNQFSGADRNYQLMISKASQEVGGVRFDDPSGAVVNRYDVPGAFTVSGWPLVQRDLEHVDELLMAEDCVMGEALTSGRDLLGLEDTLRSRYLDDYVARWRGFMDSVQISSFRSTSDAATKLGELSGPQSPLLRMLHTVAENTAVDSANIRPAFEPVHILTPAEETDRYIGGANQGYMEALAALQVSVEAVARAPSGARDQPIEQAYEKINGARLAARQAAQGFPSEGAAGEVGGTVERMLRRPIDGVERLLGAIPRADLNRQGAAFCAELQPLLRKYPFNRSATTEATLQEVSAAFKPGTGRLWTFYSEWLEDLLVQRGPSQYERRPGARFTLTSRFIAFFNQAADFSHALWPDGATDPEFSFTLRPHFTESVRRVTVNVDGQPREWSPTDVASKVFRWSGAEAQFVRVSGQVIGREEELRRHLGTWAVFKLFQEANWQTSAAEPAMHTVRWTWPLQDESVTLEAELYLGISPILKPDYFNPMRSCVSTIVQ